MLNKLFGKLSGQSRKKGFTMTELLTVIGIIAIVCAIAIPAIISISRSLAFKQANEYAESIFMAVQANLTEMKSDGRLIDLLEEGNGAQEVGDAAVATGFPDDEKHRAQYMYATSNDGVYDVLLPATSIDSDARDGNVLIEYNPYTGNVYSVFYKDGGDELSYDNIVREEEARRDLKLGYYCGSALSATPLTPEQTEANISFVNGEEFIVQVIIPIPQSYKYNPDVFKSGLEVNLTVTGEDDTVSRSGTGSFTTRIKNRLDNSVCKMSEDGKSVIVSYTLDSLVDNLKDSYSFANYGRLDGDVSPASDSNFAMVAPKSVTRKPLGLTTHLVDFDNNFNIYPGENVSIEADINFTSSSGKSSVEIHSDTLSNVNPMFGSLMKSKNDNKWVITVSNGRNLQNLNALSETIAQSVKSVSFGADIDWKNTVTYYKEKYKDIDFSENRAFTEAPARALPYFVPIHNENLFGTAQFIYPQNDKTLWEKIKQFIEDYLNIKVNQDSDVPTLTDDLDRVMSNGMYTSTPNTHATIYGGEHKVLNLDIDSSKYDLGKNFYAGDTSGANRDKFTGLFGYVNTTIDSLSVVNPTIKGSGFTGGVDEENPANNPATGALVGAAGFNTLVTNCSTYIDKAADGFNESLLPGGVVQQPAYNGEKSYGIKGNGAVGGLVGYAKSHRTVSGELKGDASTLAFSNCFAAVPVSGNMRGSNDQGGKHFGYTNGVGGLVGNAEISNFYNCYASGDVKAEGIFVDYLDDATGVFKKVMDAISNVFGFNPPNLFYNGRTSMGAGGLVGTSHGVRYTNCFASGDIIGGNESTYIEAKKKGAAGFVGIMSYEETHLYGNDQNKLNDKQGVDIAQRTVFQNCYAVGTAKIKNGSSSTATSIAESFSGANCRIKFSDFKTASKYWAGNYYQIYAPWWYGNYGTVVNNIERMPYENFIFKDSYYISKYATDSEDATNACATPLLYQSFTNLTTMQQDATWQTTQINKVKDTELSGAWDSWASTDDEEEAKVKSNNYRGIYFGEWINHNGSWSGIRKFSDLITGEDEYSGRRYGAPGYWWPNSTGGPRARRILNGGVSGVYNFDECVRTAGYKANNNPNVANISKDNWLAYYANDLSLLEGIYRELYNEGFSSDYWQAGGEGNTFAYDQTATGKYPFTKLNNLDYYGRWPARKIACGIAYYEQYGTDDYGYYFDRGGTSTLKNDPNYPVISDGYAILTGNSTDDVRIKEINGKTQDIKLTTTDSYTATYTTGDSVYYVYRLPWEALQEVSSTSFYTEIKVTVKGTLYTLYFNPNVALSQINPEDKGDNSNSKYTATETATPTQVYIRSARQLAALGKTEMNAYTANKDIKFVQQLDIDASKYTGVSYASPATVVNAVKDNKSVVSFGASYTGKTSNEKSPVISGFTHPIFTVIGDTGRVSDLEISCGANFNGSDVEKAGLLAGTNNGAVTNVDAKISAAATVSAKTSAGLLIGENAGTISSCDAVISANATVTAGENAGGLIGVNSGKVENCNAEITGSMTVNAKNAGGFVGKANSGSIFNNVEVSGKALGGSASLGAFAGTLDNARVSDVTVNIDGKITAAKTAAGLADVVKSGTLNNITVNVKNGAEIKAETAAGLIGESASAVLGDIKLNLAGAVSGTATAVGAVGDIEGGTTVNVTVLLDGGKITAANNAAGFILEADSDIQRCYVIGSGAITATAEKGNAAGFAVTVKAAENGKAARVYNCFVSPADHTKSDLKQAYRAAKLSDLKITATTGNAAGFAVNVTGVVENSTALGTVTGATNCTAGFAVKVDGGAITGSVANTDTNGNAFAAENTGLVSNSYAWYTNGNPDVIAKDAETAAALHYYACYFAPIGSENETPVTVIKGDKIEFISYDDLAKLTPEELCPASDRNIWKVAGKDSSYPFSEMRPSNYAYPMLREHYGDWVTPTQYAYGIVYYEKYTDGNIGMNLVDVSYIDANKTRQHYSMNTLQTDTMTIEETGYAVFYENASQIIIDGKGDISGYTKLDESKMIRGDLKLGDASTDMAAFLNAYDFSIWPGTTNAKETKAIVINGLDDGVHMFVPAYANAITPDWTAPTTDTPKQTYEIRTAAQFGNINKPLGDEAAPAKGFKQTHSFTMDEAVTLDKFEGLTYTAQSDDGLVHSITVGENVKLPHGIFGAVSKSAKISDVIVNDAKLKATATAGIIADTVDKDSSITDVTLNDPAIEIAATGYKANTSVDVGAVAGKNSGTIKNAAVMMSILKDENKVNIKDDYDNVLHKTFTIDASATKLTATRLQLNVGGIVGSNEGSITADKEGDKLKTSVTGNIEFTPVSYTPATTGTTTLSELVKVGGIAGVNAKNSDLNKNAEINAEINGDVVYKSFTLPADDASVKLTNEIKLGGLVGHNFSGNANGAIVSGTVTGSVNYTRPAVIADKDNAENSGKTMSDAVAIGGLVGDNQNGKITGTFDGDNVNTEKHEPAKSVKILKAVGDEKNDIFVKDVTTVTGSPTAANNYVGGIVGNMSGGSFGKIAANGDLSIGYASYDASYIGGIAGASSVAITTETVKSNITVASPANGALYAGGIVGEMTGGSTLSGSASGNMTGSSLSGSASGKLEVTGSAASAYVGGAAGQTSSTTVKGVTTDRNITVNVSTTSYVGGIVGKMTGGTMGENGSTTTANGSITVKGSATANAYVGGAVGQTNGSVNVSKADNDISISAPSGNLYAGGIVGEITGSSSLSGSASGKLTVSGNATNAYVGGAAGQTSRTTVNGVTTNRNITVDVSTTSYVGGIVGKMSYGTMGASGSTTTANGSITVKGNATANTYVGGAVGHESNATSFTNVKANVAISGSWYAKANVNSATAACPGSYANVGQFIGYVSKAKVSFTDCSGNGNNAGLQFLGTIEKTRKTLSGNYYSFTQSGKAGTVEMRDYISGWTKYKGVASNNNGVQFEPANGDTYDNYAATLTNCFYTDQNGAQHQQQINTVKYFYEYKDDNGDHKHYSIGNSVTSMLKSTTQDNYYYIIVDKNEKWALTRSGENVATIPFKSQFDNDDPSYDTIWQYTADGKSNRQKLKIVSGGYLRISTVWVESPKVSIKNSSGDAQCRIVEVDDTYVRFAHHDDDKYMYLSDVSKGIVSGSTTTSTGDNTKFKIYPVNANKFTSGTMNSTSYYHEVIT